MPAHSRARRRFTTNIQRSGNLVQMHDAFFNDEHDHGVRKWSSDAIQDLLRAAVVFAVAAMDTYFTARFAECLVPYLKKHGPSDSLIALLDKAGFTTRQALEMMDMQRPYRRVRSLIDAHLERFTTQRSDVIDELFLAYGLKDFCRHAESATKRSTLLKRIDGVVQRRHAIVHEGDLTRFGKHTPVSRSETARWLRDITTFVDAAHAITSRRIGVP